VGLLTSPVAPAAAVVGDTLADAALGQPDFTASSCNLGRGKFGPANAQGLCEPIDVAMDPTSGRLFVSDSGNSRVVSWANSRRLMSGEPATSFWANPISTVI
jgi:hypothetical protein